MEWSQKHDYNFLALKFFDSVDDSRKRGEEPVFIFKRFFNQNIFECFF